MVRVDIGCGALDIWLQCGDKRLEEHNLRAPSGIERQECYIASEDDKNFEIHVKALEDSRIPQNISFWLDGVRLPQGFISPRCAGQCKNRGSLHVSDNEIRRFTFGRLELKEDNGDWSEAAARSMNDLGTIRVRVEAVETTTAAAPAFRKVSLPGDSAVSEKAKKAGGHSIKLGEVSAVAEALKNVVNITRHRDYPVHDVVFHYAPLDVLYAREIIMRPPPQAENVRIGEASSPFADTSAAQGARRAQVSVKTEEGSLPSSSPQAGVSRKRVLESASSAESSSDESDVLAGLDKKDIRRLARIGAKLAAGLSKSKKKKTKVEPQDQPAFIPGEVIDLCSD